MKLLKQIGAQFVMRSDFVFNFDDTMKDVAGAESDFKTVGTKTFDIIGLPPGSFISGGEIVVETAYVGPTAATIDIGDSASGARYNNDVSLLAAARTALGGLGYVNTSGLPLRVALTHTVAPASAGKVRISIEYTIDGRVNEVNRE